MHLTPPNRGTKTSATAWKRTDFRNEWFEGALPASAAPICMQSRISRLCTSFGEGPAAARSPLTLFTSLFPAFQGSISILLGPLQPTSTPLPPGHRRCPFAEGGLAPTATECIWGATSQFQVRTAMHVLLGLLHTSAKSNAVRTMHWAVQSSPKRLFTCFDQLSKWYRTDPTSPKPAQQRRNR